MEKEPKYAHGVGYMFVAVFSLSLFLLFAKLGTTNTPFFLLSFLRFLVPLLLLLPFLWMKGFFEKISLFKGSESHLWRSLCVLVQQYTVFYYLLYGSVLNMTVLLNLSPIIVALIERIFFAQPIHKSVAISLIISFIGAICILQPDQGLFSLLSLIGLMAAIANAASQVLYGHNVRKEPTEISLFYLFFIGSIISLAVYLITSQFTHEPVGQEIGQFLGSNWLGILFLFALSLATLGNQAFRGIAYTHGRPATLAPFLYFSVFFSAIFDWLIFKQIPNALGIVGIFLILLGGLLQIYMSRVIRLK